MKKFLFSFVYAFSGIAYLLKERSFRIHFLALISVIIAGVYFNITDGEWIAVLTVSSAVMALEAINSAIERLCDLYSNEQNTKIKVIKDISAGAVLIVVIFAICVGCLVFWKYIFNGQS